MKEKLLFTVGVCFITMAAVAADVTPPSLKELDFRSAETFTFSHKGGSPLPLDKTYEQLSDEDKATFRSWYKNLAPGDEPPFPKDGLANLYKLAMAPGRNIHGERNMILVVAHVGVDGKAHSVTMSQTLTTKTKDWLAMIFMAVEYKPAICSGKPCPMDFPVIVDTFTNNSP